MTKLYISYYGDSVSIVEGIYKKGKFIINDVLFLSADDIEPDYSDKYKLLKYALNFRTYKSKNVALCLNTVDVIVKSNRIPKVKPKDLDNIMSMEIDEMMSLDREGYIFSYEVLKEFEEQGDEFLDLILAGMESREIESIIEIFKDSNLKLEYIDILPASYSRVLNEVEYRDIMVVNTGEYSSSIDIFKEDSLYIHDNIPVRLNEGAQIYDYIRLVDEANGLMNYYSSRNFGKTVDSILLIGKHTNNDELIESFKKLFTSKIITGIDNLYDIHHDIKGEIPEKDLNMIVDIIGCMLRDKNKSSYLNMNLLPKDMKVSAQRREKLVKVLKVMPIVLVALYLPILTLNVFKLVNEKELEAVQGLIDEVKTEYKQIEDIESNIAEKEKEVELYDMLESKEPQWGALLSAIDKNIPYRVQLDSLKLSYVQQDTDSTEQQIDQENTTEENQSTEQQTEEAVYEKVPNFITITGKGSTPSHVAQFLYNLKQLYYFDDIKLSGVTQQTSSSENSTKTSYSFSITANIKDGVVISE